ncbi:hypothetical protein [Bdellovibrio sp. HCB337]|uniref:hypothetical protein n=1 Tax=Bdellovibrio sp. HCB337 TaxID=3394358 RepID=UPI0039A41639
MKKVWVLLAAMMTASMVWAQAADLIEKSFTGTSTENTPQAARRDIQEKASQKVSEDLIKELIGEERFTKNKTLIQNKIQKLSNRYIPFAKPSELVQEGSNYKMTVTLKVSVKDLKALLQENSLLAENDTVPLVLPVIAFTDKVDLKTFRWWKPEEGTNKAFLISQNRTFENALRGAFQKHNFYLVKTMPLGLQIPRSYQNERLSLDDMQFFSQYFGAPLMIEGQVQYSKSPESSNRYRIEIKLVALQVSNGRPIADVSRKFDTEMGAFETAVDKKIRESIDGTAQELASQVYEAWQRGSLGATILRLTFRGRIPFNQKEAFKEKLKTQVREIRNIRERFVTADSVAYEVDTGLNSKDFAAKLGNLEIDGRKWRPTEQTDTEVVLQLQRQ